MTALVQEKAQDHYAVLGVDPQSVSETIQRAYAKLAQRYHSRNADTGDAAMFEALNLAYEVLSNPERRKEFDRVQGISQEGNSPQFSGLEFFESLGRETTLRTAILCLLCDRRRTRPSTPSLSMRQVEIMVEATAVELTAALWYLKQRNLVSSDDRSSLQITVDGMDFVLAKKPRPEDVMAFIKPSAIAGDKKRPGALPATAAGGASLSSTLSTLSSGLKSEAGVDSNAELHVP